MSELHKLPAVKRGIILHCSVNVSWARSHAPSPFPGTPFRVPVVRFRLSEPVGRQSHIAGNNFLIHSVQISIRWISRWICGTTVIKQERDQGPTTNKV